MYTGASICAPPIIFPIPIPVPVPSLCAEPDVACAVAVEPGVACAEPGPGGACGASGGGDDVGAGDAWMMYTGAGGAGSSGEGAQGPGIGIDMGMWYVAERRWCRGCGACGRGLRVRLCVGGGEGGGGGEGDTVG